MKTLQNLIDGIALSYGVNIMLRNKDEYVTYKGFNRRVKRNACYLAERYPKGTKIAVLGMSCIEGVEAWASVVGSGNVAVLCNDYHERSLEDVVNDMRQADVAAVLVNKSVKNVEQLQGMLPDIELIDLTKKDLSKMKEEWPLRVEEDDIAQILFTSGTTGKLKMVMLSHGNIVQNAMGAQACVEVRQGDVLVAVLPLYHGFEMVAGLLTPLLGGATVCFDDSHVRMLRNLLKNLALYQPNILILVPEFIKTLVKKASGKKTIRDIVGNNLRTIVVGGAKMPMDLMERFGKGIKIVEGYGISECSPIVACNQEDDIVIGSVGKPLAGVEVKIKEGEILVKGPNVMKGYYKDEESTRKAFDKGYFKTGDIGCFDDEGNLYVTGRIKNLIVLSNGENVSPEEIEEKLEQVDGVCEAFVEEVDGCLCATIYPDANADREQILVGIEEKNKKLPPFKRVHKGNIAFRDNPFPKTSTGKIDRKIRHY